ncbi:hypothetical protein DOK67_0002252 [Enterococcus sp. DIV0212c]
MLNYCYFCSKCIRSKDQLTDEKGNSYCSIECKEKELILEVDAINNYFPKRMLRKHQLRETPTNNYKLSRKLKGYFCNYKFIFRS